MVGRLSGFSDYELTTVKEPTKRKSSLAEMQVVVVWWSLMDLIDPQSSKTGMKGGRPPNPLTTMQRIHLQQQWYSLSDLAMEAALITVNETGATPSVLCKRPK